MGYQKIVIVSAPRSGSNMLRDALSSFEFCTTWPCDEINYIWRYTNASYPSDEFDSSMATNNVKEYIRKSFDSLAKKRKVDFVVEKTCANSLRLPFVDAVLPDAKYIFIRRHGLDVVASAIQRWRASLDLVYSYKKARFVPIRDLSYHALRYIHNRLHLLFSGERRLAFWGPQTHDMHDLLSKFSLEEVAAIQWQRCVERSYSALASMPNEKWIDVSYEQFVNNPQYEMNRILDFLNIKTDQLLIDNAIRNVHASSVGRGRMLLSEDKIDEINQIIRPTLQKFSYSSWSP